MGSEASSIDADEGYQKSKISSLPVCYEQIQRMKYNDQGFQCDNFIDKDKTKYSLERHPKVNTDEQKNELIRMPYNGIWSIKGTKGFKPSPRVGNCYVYDPIENAIFIAYGQTEEKEMLNDSWILHLDTFEWECISFNMLSPRSGASAVIIDRNVYIFGGHDEAGKNFADLHYVDLNTRTVNKLDFIPNHPSERSNSTMFTTKESLFVWSGYNGSTLTDMYEFNIYDKKWSKCANPGIEGRRIGLFASSVDKKVQYALSSESNGSEVIKFDLESKKIIIIPCAGHKPHGTLNYASMAIQNNFLFVVGGKYSVGYTYLYALNLDSHLWHKLYVIPDGRTVSKDDGSIDKSGLFQLPRINGQTMIYSPKDMSLYAIFGNNYLVPCPAQKIELGQAIAILNHREDMKNMLLMY